jgi:hypothetical protein
MFGITSTLRALEQPTTLKNGMGKSRRKFNIVTQTFTPFSDVLVVPVWNL